MMVDLVKIHLLVKWWKIDQILALKWWVKMWCVSSIQSNNEIMILIELFQMRENISNQ